MSGSSFPESSFTWTFIQARATLSRGVMFPCNSRYKKLCRRCQIQSSIQVSIKDDSAFMTDECPIGKSLVMIYPATARACFRGWIPPAHDMDSRTGLLSFVGQLLPELVESHISYCPAQFPIFEHARHIQILYHNALRSFAIELGFRHDLSSCFVQCIGSDMCYSCMLTCQFTSGFLAVLAALCFSRVGASQPLELLQIAPAPC